MNNEDNPYYNLIQLFKGDRNQTIPFFVGDVISGENFIIKIADNMQIDKSDLLVSANIGELKSGDKVVVLATQDYEQFILISKVI